MSFWLTYRDGDGRQKWISAGISFTAVVVSTGVVVALLLPIVQYLRQLFH